MTTKHYSRTHTGFRSIMHDILTDVLGLSDHAVGKIMQVVKSSGESQRTRKHMRKLRYTTFTRLGQAVNRATDDVKKHNNKEKVEEQMITFKQFLLQEDITADQATLATIDAKIQQMINRKNQIRQGDPANVSLDKQLAVLKQQKAVLAGKIAKAAPIEQQKQQQQMQQTQQALK